LFIQPGEVAPSETAGLTVCVDIGIAAGALGMLGTDVALRAASKPGVEGSPENDPECGIEPIENGIPPA
jgi:hypothetical protein